MFSRLLLGSWLALVACPTLASETAARPKRAASRVKNVRDHGVDGGVLENVTISRVSIKTTSNALFVRLGHRRGLAPGTVRNVVISDVTAEIPDRPRREMNKFSGPWRHRCQTMVPASITSLPGHPVREIVLRDWTLVYGGAGENAAAIPDLAAVPEATDRYPECTMFGPLPAWGLHCRHVEGLTLERAAFRLVGRDARPALVCDDVRRVALTDVTIEHPGRTGSHVLLNDVAAATIRGTSRDPDGGPLVEQRGDTRDVTIDATAGR